MTHCDKSMTLQANPYFYNTIFIENKNKKKELKIQAFKVSAMRCAQRCA
jgi:hypothetical protein